MSDEAAYWVAFWGFCMAVYFAASGWVSHRQGSRFKAMAEEAERLNEEQALRDAVWALQLAAMQGRPVRSVILVNTTEERFREIVADDLIHDSGCTPPDPSVTPGEQTP